MPPKEIINQNNIKQYFDYRAVGPSQLKPGMLVSFRYQSPDYHIHDMNPLVYILERKVDRIYGLNLHYHFGLMGGLILNKRKELEAKTGYHNATNDPAKPNQPNVPAGTKIVNAATSAQTNQQKQQAIAAAKAQERLNKLKGIKPIPGKPIVQPIEKPKIIRIPPILLETYELQIEPVQILRNYLFIRMSGLQKLIFKP